MVKKLIVRVKTGDETNKATKPSKNVFEQRFQDFQ